MKFKTVSKLIQTAMPWVLGACALASANAAIVVNGATFTPLITAGAPPDSPVARIDPNLPTSPFSGVVSINIRFSSAETDSFICTGTLVSKRDVVTAGHCVDSDGNGTLIDITKPGADVRVIFNAEPNPGDAGRAIITADKVSINPSYQGFGNCPVGSPSSWFCLNDDVAVVHMNQDAPSTAKIYKMYSGEIGEGQLITMAGYGTSGDGINGYTVNPAFRVKRSGQNIMDVFDTDDETLFSNNSPKEVWYADFDGGGRDTDTFCAWGLACTPILANDKESMIGGGDSGGPSFIDVYGELMLVGNNTFSSRFGKGGPIPGAFGNYFGGMMLNAYTDYLVSATDGAIGVVPEPGSLALMGLALAGLGATRKRKAQAAA